MALYFEDHIVGQVIKHEPGRTITEADNVMFCALTMNPQPLYLDHEYAKGTEFGRPLVNPLFPLALSGGLMVHDATLGTIVANLAVGDIEFLKPIYYGDTIYSETEVLEKKESKRPDAGVVRCEQRVLNQRGELVMRWFRTALVLHRPTA